MWTKIGVRTISDAGSIDRKSFKPCHHRDNKMKVPSERPKSIEIFPNSGMVIKALTSAQVMTRSSVAVVWGRTTKAGDKGIYS